MVELVRRDQQRVSMWSGGTTTEIAIYPKDAVYSRRDFLWRISSAHVDTENSAFTSLPGIWRLIMVLEGELTLEHEDHHSARLQPFQQDAFAGDWITRSKGRARDFNIMLARGCTAELHIVCAEPQSRVPLPARRGRSWDKQAFHALVVYGVEGAAAVEAGVDGVWDVHAGDVLLLTTGGHQMTVEPMVALCNDGDAVARAVVARISFPGSL